MHTRHLATAACPRTIYQSSSKPICRQGALREHDFDALQGVTHRKRICPKPKTAVRSSNTELGALSDIAAFHGTQTLVARRFGIDFIEFHRISGSKGIVSAQKHGSKSLFPSRIGPITDLRLIPFGDLARSAPPSCWRPRPRAERAPHWLVAQTSRATTRAAAYLLSS